MTIFSLKLKPTKFIYTVIILLIFSTSVNSASGELAKKRYVDPNNFFTIVPPAQWEIQKYPKEQRGKVAFLAATKRVELRVLAAAVDFDTIDELISGSKAIEERIGESTNIKKVTFNGRPAISRSFIFNGTKLLLYDFLVGNIHYNIQFGALPSDFPKFHSLAIKSMATYEPLLRSGSSDEILEHTLAGDRRLAELLIEMGRMDMASEYIEEGLKLAPSDTHLIKLKARIKSMTK